MTTAENTILYRAITKCTTLEACLRLVVEHQDRQAMFSKIEREYVEANSSNVQTVAPSKDKQS